MNWRPILEKLRQAIPEYQVWYVTAADPVLFEEIGVEISLIPGTVEVESQGEISTITNLYRRFFSVATKARVDESEEPLSDLLDRQRAALIGWREPQTNSAIQYEGGDPDYIDGLMVQWIEVYSVTFTRSHQITSGP